VAEYPGPLKHEMFDAGGGQLANALRSAESTTSSRSGDGLCPEPKWGITEITLSCAGNTSTSYDNPSHDPIPGGKEGRFYFAPIEEQVTVAWQLKNPAKATTLTLQLYRANSTDVLWSVVLDAKGARALKLDEEWNGSISVSASFPHGLVTVEHSPYKLKATAGPNHEDDLEVRWTYFDVLIEKIELTWGGKALIPAGNPGDVVASYLNQTLADEQAINDALAPRKLGDETLDPGDAYEVKLPCNRFTDFVWDMYDTHQSRRVSLWLHHKNQWGDGPRIPLVAKVYVAKAAGGGVHGGDSAKALGGTKFLWDWESDDEIAGLGAAGHHANVRAFLTRSLEYLRNDGQGPPGSTNCHEDRGGKRGGAKKVFPAPLAGVSAGTANCATRTWATQVQAMLTGANAGKVGVLFQPSRIALDTYIVSVYASPDIGGGGPAALDVADSATTLRANHPSLPRAASGTFEMLRGIQMHYVRKSAAVEAAVLADITQEYRRAGLALDWGNSQVANEALLAANFDAWFQTARDNPDQKAQGKVERNRAWFEANDQFQAGTGAGTSYSFIVKSWEFAKRKVLADSTREYVQRWRLVNTPRTRYNRWLALPGNTAANDDQYLIPFYNGLSAKKKRLVDEIFARRSTESQLPPLAETFDNDVTGACCELTRLVAEQFLTSINQPGMVVFHVEAPVAYRQIDGTIVVPHSSQGGFSPSTSAQKFAGLGAVHMVYLPETPAVDPAAKYHTRVTKVVIHEAGHNLFLCHATVNVPPAAGPTPRLHDVLEPDCLMSYDAAFDHLCGYCNLKLRGWITAGKGNNPPEAGVELMNAAAQNERL
jgi:hypothetical protein